MLFDLTRPLETPPRPSLASTQRIGVFAAGLAFILLGALVARGALVQQLLGSIWGDVLLLDEVIVDRHARELASGALFPSTPFEFPPFPAYVAAAVYSVVGPDPLALRVVSFAAGVIVVAVVGLAVWRATSSTVASWAAAAVVAVHGPSLLASGVVLKTALVALLVAISAAALTGRRRTATDGLVGGAAAAAAFFSQGQTVAALICFVAATLVGLARRRRRHCRRRRGWAVAGLLGVAAVATPLMLANARRGAAAPFLPSQSGANFYFANQPGDENPFFHPTPFSSSDPARQIPELHLVAEADEGHPLTMAEGDRHWQQLAWRGIAAAPLLMVKRTLWRIDAVFHPREVCDHYAVDVVAADVAVLRLPWLTSSPIFIVAVVFLPFAWRRRSARLVVVGFVGALAVLAVTSPTARYRTALVPAAVVVAAVGVAAAVAAWRRHHSRAAVVAVTVAGVAVVVAPAVPLPHGDLSGLQNVRASLLDHAQRPREAAALRRSIVDADGSYADYARLALADVAFGAHDDEAGEALLDDVGDGDADFAAAPAAILRCAVHLERGAVDEAAAACARARALQPASVEACQMSERVAAAANDRAVDDSACADLITRLGAVAPFARLELR